MRIKKLHPNFSMPSKGTKGAGAFDIFMPTDGSIVGNQTVKVGLGFAAEVPEGHVALLLPRSSSGSKYGLELNNSCGVIDSDYRGEWIANLRTKSGQHFSWETGERVLQFIIVPVANIELQLAETLDSTERGTGGFGSSGK